MHEVSLCRQLAVIVGDAAAGRLVHQVRVDVGRLRQVVPESLCHAWGFVVHGTPLAGSVLDVRQIPVVLGCRQCGARSTPAPGGRLDCSGCGSPLVEVLDGEQFTVVSIEVGDPATAPGKDAHGPLPSS